MSPFLFSNPKTKSNQARNISPLLDLSSVVAIVKVPRASWSQDSLLVNLKRLRGLGNDMEKSVTPKKRGRHLLHILRPLLWWLLLVLVMFGIRTHQRLMEQTR